MAKDFSYLFYPGDVLRQIQFFNSAQKSCYLDVLTSHIENIRFSYDFLMKITRQLNDTERTDFLEIFEKDDKGYFLEWASVAIEKRSAYLLSRGANKAGKKKVSKPTKKKKSYDSHMENKNKNENKEELETKIEIIYPFDSEKFNKVWNILIKEPKWKKKTDTALQACLKQLSQHSERDAIQMIENSIAGGWQGLFELKNNINGKQIRKGQPDTKDALDWANKVLSGEHNNGSDTIE